MDKLTTTQEALDYHSKGRPGKIEVTATKPCLTQIDLSLAYTPGVAEPCRAIAADPDKVFDYTAKGNLIAVVTDGSAVLGLGNIGPDAGKPVMEGKAVLFKRFADIDVFDIELGTQDTEEIIAAVKAIAPTFSGINLEDISSPRCFEIEKRLSDELDIPVFHDDQHGTALITGAALINAMELADKRAQDVRVVVNGAGAAAVACANYAISLGVRREHIMMCDSKGVIYKDRTAGMNEFKEAFAVETEARSLADAMVDADVFIGVSVGNVVSKDMLRSMAATPIVLAMSNPDPEIPYADAISARDDVIMATGRSDHPNQVNNVLGFPFLFRGALDVRASCINMEMMHAATRALADLAKEPVPSSVARAYGVNHIEFGKDYLIPKPLDQRVLSRVCCAVAKAAMDSGVARRKVDLDAYEREVMERLGPGRDLMSRVVASARRSPRRILYPEGAHPTTLRAVGAIAREGIANPVVVGCAKEIRATADQFGLSMEGIEIVDPATDHRRTVLAEELCQVRSHRSTLSGSEASERMLDPIWFASMLLRKGIADGMVCGVTRRVRKTIQPVLKVIPLRDGYRRACGLSITATKRGALFLADTAVNIDPSAEDLAEIVLLAADGVRRLGEEPVIAMLSFSSYGGSPHPRSDMVRRAVELARAEDPELQVDGEMRVDAALDPSVRQRYADNRLGDEPANVLVFPNLEAANIGFNLVRMLGDAETFGPLILGLDKSVSVLQPHSAGVEDVIRMTAITVVDTQDRSPLQV
ncbi:MAG: malate dehydrogenase (oxaloacetate-decarboxylating)(NADP+) [Candidatus Paceibacteria bacterium]|jgi:malate dehydrogenase (oxaloacetate-decarboxylating)(NADP+)